MSNTVNVDDIVTAADVVRMSGFSAARVSGILARTTPLKPLAKGQTALYDAEKVRETLRKDFATLLSFLDSSRNDVDTEENGAEVLDA